ncbi:hypothetical protein DFJ77DRAFT_233633 [Powellomyces hirtus]|nr:hypothetical protein DFJ77DRAFT_233633 [Powellomyces hirtus]
MEAIFGRCLRKVPSVELWKFYLNYVRRTHTAANMPPERKAEARATIMKAYEFVLQNIGSDKEAGYIWTDYIQFVKSGETSSIYEDQQQMDLLRRAYNRAIWIPSTNIEQLWKDYDAFENGLNKLTAKKFLSEKSAGYMTARTAIRELKTLLDPIEKAQKSWMAKPPTWIDKEVQMLAAWKRYIAWERSNPLRLDDKSMWISRVMYAYKTCLLMLRYYPEIYYEASSFLKEVGKPEEAAAMLKSGVETLPTSLLLNLSLAELEESRKRDFKEISVMYETLITKLEATLTETNAKYDSEREKLMASLQKGDESSAPDDWDGERREREREKQKERQLEVEQKVEEKRKKELENIKRALSLVWVVYMRASRRAQNITAARIIFTRARKSAHCTYHVWVAAALMEYFCNKDANVAGRVFEIGLKSFNPAEDPQAPEFILHYLDFLINLNDDNNTRALFERALSALPADRAKPIWAKLLAYETEYGDLANVLKSEKRRADAYPGEANNSLVALSYLADRWSFLEINHVGEFELGLPAQYDLEKKVPGTVAGVPLSSAATAHAAASSASSHHHASKIDDRGAPQRKYQSLESVHPERYPRPDLNKWMAYKPETAASASGPGAPGGDHADTGGAGEGAGDRGQPPAAPGILVPDAVARLMAVLPPANIYNGPILPINDIIDLFRQIPLPTPATPPLMVSVPSTSAAQSSAQQGPSSSFPDRGGQPYGRSGPLAGYNQPPPQSRGFGGGFSVSAGGSRDMDRGGGRGRGRGRVRIPIFVSSMMIEREQ